MPFKPSGSGGSGGGGGGVDTNTGIPVASGYRWVVDNNRLEVQDSNDEIMAYFDETGSYFKESVSTGVGSYHLGGGASGGMAHSLSSAGQNVGFKNEWSNALEDDRVFWFPAWQGLSTDGETNYDPSTLALGGMADFEPNGALDPAQVEVDYNFTTVITANFVVTQLQVVPTEIYTGKLKNKIYAGGIEIYSTDVDVDWDVVDLGTSRVVGYKYPYFARAGDALTLTLEKEDGTFLKVLAGATDTAIPYRTIRGRAFEDQPADGSTTTITEDRTLIAGGDYAVNTTDGPINITVNTNNTKRTFTIYDALGTFNTNACTIEFDNGQGNAVLQTKEDAFKFYWVVTDDPGTGDGAWRYIDLNYKDGGTV